MSQLQTTKSILAKLLANENITVSHQPIKTAYFDLQSRTLVCPIWHDMDGDLYDLLMGHEVGHATETPTQGWHDALKDENGNPVPRAFKDFLNVLEDARIEKKIKRRYPGLSKSFSNAYKSLHERNFFEIRDMDINKFNFIDRINIYCKLGAHMHVSWKSDWERDIIREVGELETWEQVVELAKKIFEYVKEEEEPEIQNEQDMQQMKREMRDQQMQEMFGDEGDSSDSEDEDYDDESDDSDYEDAEGSDDDSDSSEDSDEESASGGSADGDGETDEEEESVEDNSNTSKYSRQFNQESPRQDNDEITRKVEGDYSDDPQSVTDRAFRRREKELVNASGKVYMLNLPDANLDKILISNKIVMDDLERFFQSQLTDPYSIYCQNKVSYETLAAKCAKKFNARNKKFIMHIFKEFDMRKRATDYARTSISRSGELNMNLLHKYKHSNDIFKKIAVIQKGKNHGLIMYVDMSGSMADILKNTIEQTLVLVSFCKLANIPFEVYGFSNDAYSDSAQTHIASSQFSKEKFSSDNKTELSLDAFCFNLKHLIGSSLSSVAYRRSFNNLAIIVNEYGGRQYNRNGYVVDPDVGSFQYDWTSGGFGLNGTPYIETLLASREMIKKFRVNNKLDIVNVLYLTDGDGNTHLNYPPNITWRDRNESTFYLVDKKTQRKVRRDHTVSDQVAITRLVKEITGCKHLGFYLADKRAMRDALARVRYENEAGVSNYSSNELDDMRHSVRENNFFAVSSVGYDKYFFVTSSTKNIEEDKLEIDASMTKYKMANAFKKSMNSKRTNRILVSKFAEELAVGL